MTIPSDSGGVADSRFKSKLSAPRDRFLAAVVEHALAVGRRTAKDFLRCFPPRDIMNALAEQPNLRAKILVSTTGVNEKVALRKPASSAGEDLDIALIEGVTDEASVIALFDPDDRVRYLEHTRLWDFVAEGEFWRANAATSVVVPREHIAFILSRGRAEKLISDGEIIDGIGLDVLVGSLPKADIVRVLDRVIGEGRAGKVLKDERVLDILSPDLLVEHVSLAHLWERLVAAKLAFGRPPAVEVPAATTTVEPSHTSPTTPPPSAASVTVTSEVPTAGLFSDVPVALGSDLGPSLNVSIEEGDPIELDETREEDIEVEAVLAKAKDGGGPESRRTGRPSTKPLSR